MSLLEKLFAAGQALRAGESLKDPAMWKNTQLLMNPFLMILGMTVQFAGIEATDAQINAVSYGLATLAVLLNSYFTVATTTKIGLPTKG